MKPLVWGSMSCGLGARPVNTVLSHLDIPSMTHMCSNVDLSLTNHEFSAIPQKTFSEMESIVGGEWMQHAENAMMEAHNQEISHAKLLGQLYDGKPWLRVVIDGGWSKRSHGHSYNAPAGILSH